jgi:dTMP kinase
MYIVFEGVVGTGKTTQSKMIADFLKEKYPSKEVVWTREPGGSEIAEAIRKVVQGTSFEEQMDPVCEVYLYAAARAQSLRSVVKPVLDRGGIVVADRSFFTSVSWQGYGRGLGKEIVMKVNEMAIQDITPDAVCYLYGDIDAMMARTFDASGDKFEKFPKVFFEACERGYEELAQDERFSSMWQKISAHGSKEEVFARILFVLGHTLGRGGFSL